MNFLQLCQDVMSESGTANPTALTSVVGQSGRLGKFVSWTSKAYEAIQTKRADWLWLQAEFSCAIVANTSVYSPATWSLTRHRRWVTDQPNYRPVTIYKTATGVSDECDIPEMQYQSYRSVYGRGTQLPGRPLEYAIDQQNRFCVGPVPDADYTVRGEYVKSIQTLALDADVPEMPAEFHRLIVWKALMLLALHDEAVEPIKLSSAVGYHDAMMRALEGAQLPRMAVNTIGGPLA